MLRIFQRVTSDVIFTTTTAASSSYNFSCFGPFYLMYKGIQICMYSDAMSQNEHTSHNKTCYCSEFSHSVYFKHLCVDLRIICNKYSLHASVVSVVRDSL